MIARENEMKKGYWMISSDRNGGYAYAKVCSNGEVFKKIVIFIFYNFDSL